MPEANMQVSPGGEASKTEGGANEDNKEIDK
jgi:hypothetical protein